MSLLAWYPDPINWFRIWWGEIYYLSQTQQRPPEVPWSWKVLSKYLLSKSIPYPFLIIPILYVSASLSLSLSSSTGYRWYQCCSPCEDWKSSQTDVLFIAPKPGITKHLHLLPIRGETDCSFMHCMWLDIFLFGISLKISECIIGSYSLTSSNLIENAT